MFNNFERGSEWRKWDLHLHTPLTRLSNGFLVPEGQEIWDKFSDEIENSDVDVFGITDYYSVENYFTFVEHHRNKYPDSVKQFFPNIEFRLEVSVNLNAEEVNLHIIFDNKVEKTKIESFLRKLKTNIVRSGVAVTCYELSTPSDYETAGIDYKTISVALKEVFGNDVCYLILAASNNTGLRPDNNSPRKLNISDQIDKICDAFFGGQQNVDYYLNVKRYEEDEIAKAKPVISGCDAHSFDDLDNWLGKRFEKNINDEIVIEKDVTWIKADPTFEGLKQLLVDPSDRVFIGRVPRQKENVEMNSSKFIDRISVNNRNSGSNTSWFDNNIVLNPGLVSIIGNKGSGKSALADIVALLGKSHTGHENNSFLNADKFWKVSSARDYTASIVWRDNTISKCNTLVDTINKDTEVEKVKYLPQKYVETICNDVGVSNDFQKEIDKVVFGFVPDTDNHGMNNLEDLIAYQTKSIDTDLSNQRQEIKKIIGEYLVLDKKSRKEYLSNLTNKLKEKKTELLSLKEPIIVEEPSENIDQEKQEKIDALALRVKKLTEKIDSIEILLKDVNKSITDFNNLVGNIETLGRDSVRLKEELDEFSKVSKVSNVEFDDLFEFKKNTTLINSVKDKLQEKQNAFKYNLNKISQTDDLKEEENFVINREKVRNDLKIIRDTLGVQQKAYQEFLKRKENWTKSQNLITGKRNDNSLETINSIESEIEYVETELSEDKIAKYAVLIEASILLYKAIFSKKSFYEKLYKPLNDFISNEQEKLELDDSTLSFDVGVTLDKALFASRFLDLINRTSKGSFRGTENSRVVIKEILGRFVLDTHEKLDSFLNEIMENLTVDKSESGEPRIVSEQLVSGENKEFELYELVFGLEYLDVKYKILFNEKDLNNNELSPGEKGAILLIFYLLIEKENTPLIIDQPEENLDNESVVDLLVPCIKEAKKRRQVIIVTHNPNLAVVCDSEQIIYCKMDKQKNEIRYSSGSIENPYFNKKIIDVLEGKMPAFRKRDEKYFANN